MSICIYTCIPTQVLPICGEVLWVDLFIVSNTVFCMMALLQSCVTIMLETVDTEHLLPKWMIFCWQYIVQPQLVKLRPKGRPEDENIVEEDKEGRESVAGLFYRELLRETGGMDAAGRTRRGSHNDLMMQAVHEARDGAGGGTSPRAAQAAAAGTRTSEAGSKVKLTDRLSRVSFEGAGGSTPDWTGKEEKIIGEEDAHRLVYFENLFFKLDADMSGEISRDECFSLFSFAALDMSVATRQAAFDAADTGNEGDGVLNRLEFLELCIQELWNVPMAQIDLALENVTLAKTAHSRKYLHYWQGVADMVDGWARVIIPYMYAISMIVIFSLDLEDVYETDLQFAMSSEAIVIKGMKTSGVVVLSLVLGLTFISVCGYALMQHVTFKERKERREKEEKEITKRREERLQHATKCSFQRSRTRRSSCSVNMDAPSTPVQVQV